MNKLDSAVSASRKPHNQTVGKTDALSQALLIAAAAAVAEHARAVEAVAAEPNAEHVASDQPLAAEVQPRAEPGDGAGNAKPLARASADAQAPAIAAVAIDLQTLEADAQALAAVTAQTVDSVAPSIDVEALPEDALLAQNEAGVQDQVAEAPAKPAKKKADDDTSPDASHGTEADGAPGGVAGIALAGLALGVVALAASNSGGDDDAPSALSAPTANGTPTGNVASPTNGTTTGNVAPATNGAPTAISLTTSPIGENAAGAMIGALTVTDPDLSSFANGQHTLGLNDARFEVVNGTLKLKDGIALDHETEPTVNLTITATDGGGLSTSQTFVIQTKDVNEAPNGIALSKATVAENAAGARIGDVLATDPDTPASLNGLHSFAVNDTRFEVVDGTLKLKDGIALDYETEPTVNLTLTATDGGGLSTSQTFAIQIDDRNESPAALSLSNVPVDENAPAAIIGNLSATDPDAGDTRAFSVADARFEVVSGTLKLKDGITLDHETEPTVNLTITATDGGGLSTSRVFNVAVNDVHETTVLTGTEAADAFNHAGGLDHFIIAAKAGHDIIQTSDGFDIVRPGEGADQVSTGAGSDLIVVVGQTAVNQYTLSDINNPGGSAIDLSTVLTLDNLNGRATSEVVPGETIDGGAGTNRLVVYGNVDLTGVTLTNIAQFQANSTLTISAQQLNVLDPTHLLGDSASVLNITNARHPDLAPWRYGSPRAAQPL